MLKYELENSLSLSDLVFESILAENAWFERIEASEEQRCCGTLPHGRGYEAEAVRRAPKQRNTQQE
jgi:hypothetical protein